MTGDPFLRWDAAYVLGALSPSDRRAYEEHLPGCAACTAALAEVAGVPGMLARVEPAVALELDATSIPPAGLLNGLLERAGQVGAAQPDTQAPHTPSAVPAQRSLGRRWLAPALAAAAAALLVIGVSVVRDDGNGGTGSQPSATAVEVALDQVDQDALTATARLSPVDAGTAVLLTCSLAPEPYGSDWHYNLVVVDRDGGSTIEGSWTLSPGESAEWEATTEVPMEDIATIEIRDDMGQTLLRGVPAPESS